MVVYPYLVPWRGNKTFTVVWYAIFECRRPLELCFGYVAVLWTGITGFKKIFKILIFRRDTSHTPKFDEIITLHYTSPKDRSSMMTLSYSKWDGGGHQKGGEEQAGTPERMRKREREREETGGERGEREK